LSHVKNIELRDVIKKEKMYIYIEGKEPVARKSKSLAEMGVKDGDNLIVTTEMKMPFDVYSDEEDDGVNTFGAAEPESSIITSNLIINNKTPPDSNVPPIQ